MLRRGSATESPVTSPLALRPIQIWVPDLRSPAFVAEARKQSLAVARSSYVWDDQDLIDVISDPGEM